MSHLDEVCGAIQLVREVKRIIHHLGTIIHLLSDVANIQTAFHISSYYFIQFTWKIHFISRLHKCKIYVYYIHAMSK